MVVNINDKKEWLEKHGTLDIIDPLRSSWVSKGGWHCLSWRPTADDAISDLYDRVYACLLLEIIDIESGSG